MSHKFLENNGAKKQGPKKLCYNVDYYPTSSLPLFASSCAYALDLCVTEVQNDRDKKRRTEARNEGLGSGLLNI